MIGSALLEFIDFLLQFCTTDEKSTLQLHLYLFRDFKERLFGISRSLTWINQRVIQQSQVTQMASITLKMVRQHATRKILRYFAIRNQRLWIGSSKFITREFESGGEPRFGNQAKKRSMLSEKALLIANIVKNFVIL